MKKIILVVGMVLMYVMGTSQAISQRGTSAVTVQDARLFAQYNFRPPVFQDTVAANLNLGLDSCGTLIFARSINGYYYRACSPKRWVKVSAQGSVGVDSAYISSATISSNAFILCRTSGTCDTILLRDTLIPQPPSYQTRLVSGSAVWDTLLDYNVTNCSYFILGNFYTSLATTVTLVAADSSNPRIDVIYLDTLGHVGVITGIPSPDPIKPVVDPLSQIELTHINIDAQGTSPSGLSKQIVYDENLQVPSEWNTPASITQANYDYLISPYVGLKSINSTSSTISSLGGVVQFNNSHNVNIDTCSLLSMYLRQNGAVIGIIGRIETTGAIGELPSYYVQLFKGGTGVTNKIGIANGFYGYNRLLTLAYQNVVVPFTDFTFANSLDKTFDQIVIYNVASTKATAQFDYVTIQTGGNVSPVISNYWSLSGNDNSSIPTAKLGTTSNDQLTIVTNDIERINVATNGVISFPNIFTTSDTTEYKPLSIGSTGAVSKMTSWGNNSVYTVNPIMSTVSNDSNIIYFNADTAAAWRGGGTFVSPNLQQVLDSGNTAIDKSIILKNSFDTTNIYTKIDVAIDGGKNKAFEYHIGTPADSYYANISLGVDYTYGTKPYIEGLTLANEYPFKLTGDSLTFGNNNYADNYIKLTSGGNQTKLALPQSTSEHFLATSVNNNYADENGDITISTSGATPNLQQVLDSGNVAQQQEITLIDSFTHTYAKMAGSGTYSSAEVEVADDTLANLVRISSGGIEMYGTNPTINFYRTGLINTITTLNIGNTSSNTNHLILPEDSSGVLALSVNGHFADTSGNITISTGGVDSIYRTVGKDSIYYIKNGNTYAIKDSVGSGSGGGGSAVSYYLNGGTAASVATYYQMINTAVVGTNADFSLAGNGLISQWLTDVGNPNQLQIAAGNWNFEMYMSASSSGGTPAFYVQLLKYDGSTFTSIASSSVVPENIIGGTSIDLYLTSLAVPQTTLLATDRLAVRVYIVNSVGGRTITMHTQDSHLCQIITNFSSGISALNGLTSTTQTFATGTDSSDFKIVSSGNIHKFNLPTASATKRGALSSTDWSTFNGKIGAADTSIFQRKSIAAYSFMANNTPSAANTTAQVFNDSSVKTYPATNITWTGGTAPSTLTTNTYTFTQVGKMVNLYIYLVYTNAGIAPASLTLQLPSDVPQPSNLGLSPSAGNYTFCSGLTYGRNTLTTQATTFGVGSYMRRNAGNTAWEMFSPGAGGSTRIVMHSFNYKTD